MDLKSVAHSALHAFTAGIEGPACDAQGNVYAVNFDHDGAIGIVTPAGLGQLFVELPTGSVGNGIRFDSKGDMLIADFKGHHVLRVDMATRQVTTLAHEPRMNQPNDICIDRQDRVYASDPKWDDNTGQLWRVDPDGSTHLLETGMGTTNGIEVSQDERSLYVNESNQRRVWGYDLKEGQVSNKRLLIEFPDFGLDGMRCDTDGNLWVTRYGKGTVVKLSPAGHVLAEIQVGGARPSNLCFGGSDGRTVYVTVVDNGSIEKFQADAVGREWALWRERGK